MKKLLTLLVPLVLVAAACGDDDGGGSGSGDTDSPIAQAIADDIMNDPDGPPIERSEAECIGGNIVSSLGEERLDELGVTAETAGDIGEVAFTDEEAGQVVDAFFDCADIGTLLVEQMVGEGTSDEDAECLVNALGDDTLRNFMQAALLSQGEDIPDDVFNAMIDAFAECDIQPS